MTAPDPDAPTDPVVEPSTDPKPEPDPKADPNADELAAKDAQLRKANGEARKYRLELEALKQAGLSETERAVALARAEGITEGTKAGAARLVDAEVRAAAAGRNVDVKALLEGLDRSRFIDDDGEPNTDRIAKWVDRIAPVQEQTQPGAPRVPTGPRGPANQTRAPEQVFADFLTDQLHPR